MGNGVWELYGQRRKQAEGNLRHTNEIHESVRNEKVETERAALRSMHTESRNSKEEERIGISHTPGLHLCEVQDIDVCSATAK